MKLTACVVTAAMTLAAAGPAFAQQSSDEQTAAEQARANAARQNTKMTYTDESRYVSASIVDPYTQARNNRNKGALDIKMPDGH